MAVEHINIVESHATEAFGRAMISNIFSRTPVAIWSRPHIISGFRRNEQLVAVWAQGFVVHVSECFLGSAVARRNYWQGVKGNDAVVESVV